jgi:hypothetical protein
METFSPRFTRSVKFGLNLVELRMFHRASRCAWADHMSTVCEIAYCREMLDVMHILKYKQWDQTASYEVVLRGLHNETQS